MKKIYLGNSIILAIFLVVTSLFGLLNPDTYIEETANWTAQVIAQDWVNLIIAIPVLLISAIFAYKKSLRGYLIWLGTLIFLAYSFAIYAFDVHMNNVFIIYVAILGLSSYTLIFSLAGLDFSEIKKRFNQKWTGRGLSYLLITTAVIFGLLWIKTIFNFMTTGNLPTDIINAGIITNPVYILDLAFLLPSLVISGILLKKRKAVGYVISFATLTALILLAINIIAINIVVEIKGLGSQSGLSIAFGLIIMIYSYFLIDGLYSLRSKSS